MENMRELFTKIKEIKASAPTESRLDINRMRAVVKQVQDKNKRANIGGYSNGKN